MSSCLMPEPPWRTSGMPVTSASFCRCGRERRASSFFWSLVASPTAPWMLPMATESQSQEDSATKRSASSTRVKPLPEAEELLVGRSGPASWPEHGAQLRLHGDAGRVGNVGDLAGARMLSSSERREASTITDWYPGRWPP